MVCKCDAGYSGADCSIRRCKYGYDPLFIDHGNTHRYSNWTYVFYTRASATLSGYYSITFYDVFGEDWQSDPIDIGGTCKDVIRSLENLPNRAIPHGSTRCYSEVSTYSTSGSLGTILDTSIHIQARFTIAFPSNPGKLKQPDINIFLDGYKPTVKSSESVSTVGVFVYANGFKGEFKDYVSDYCSGVTVTLHNASAHYHTLGGMSTYTSKLLKKCLGDADGNPTSYEKYNWDYGTQFNPHLIKLVDTTASPLTNLCPYIAWNVTTCHVSSVPGFYAALYFNPKDASFRLYNPVATDYSSSTTFYVFSTTGTLQMVNDYVDAFSITPNLPTDQRIARYHSNIMYTTNTTSYGLEHRLAINATFLGNVDCETVHVYYNDTVISNSNSPSYGSSANYAMACISKNDLVMFFNPDDSNYGAAYNPPYLNLYTVQKISRENKTPTYARGYRENERNRFQIKLDSGVNGLYSLGVTDSVSGTGYQPAAYSRVYKFIPPEGTKYVEECSGRGVCDERSGVCSCFAGYTSDDCSVQDSVLS